jgi:glycosyltransferase involved in cell wall biosynthesis
MVKASIIIPTYNRVGYLVDTLKSVQGQDHVTSAVELIIVDNASTDATSDTIETIRSDFSMPLRYIYEDKIGLHHSRHAGAAAAQGEILAFIDDDVRLSPSWLAAILQAYTEPRTSAAGGRVLPEWEGDPPEFINHLRGDYLSLLDYGEKARPLSEREGINGCNYSVRRKTLFDVGGFHPDSFSDPTLQWLRGDGEAGLTKKIFAAGGQIMYIPNATVWHQIPTSRQTVDYFHRRGFAHGVENAFTYARKRNCSPWSIAMLIVGGLILSKIYAVQSSIAVHDHGLRIRESVQSTRYEAIYAYGRRLRKDQALRAHVMKTDYMSDKP